MIGPFAALAVHLLVLVALIWAITSLILSESTYDSSLQWVGTDEQIKGVFADGSIPDPAKPAPDWTKKSWIK